jgi:hypothetical protein
MALARGEAGRRAEVLAADFLAGRGLVIVARNFRCRRGVIDVIARDGETLVFVEVRLRSRQDYGGAAYHGGEALHSPPRRSSIWGGWRHAAMPPMRCSSTRSTPAHRMAARHHGSA